DDGFAREDVALRGAELSALVARPGRGLRTGVSGVLSLRVHHRELPAGLRPRLAGVARVGIALEDRLHDLVGLLAFAQERDRLRTVAHVHDRLRRRDADVGFGPQHAVADGE